MLIKLYELNFGVKWHFVPVELFECTANISRRSSSYFEKPKPPKSAQHAANSTLTFCFFFVLLVLIKHFVLQSLKVDANDGRLLLFKVWLFLIIYKDEYAKKWSKWRTAVFQTQIESPSFIMIMKPDDILIDFYVTAEKCNPKLSEELVSKSVWNCSFSWSLCTRPLV